MTLVTVNVGGTEYTTAISTLCRYPDSMLARMFEGNLAPTSKDSKGRCVYSVCVDRFGGTDEFCLVTAQCRISSCPSTRLLRVG